jgi:hypothetical protein
VTLDEPGEVSFHERVLERVDVRGVADIINPKRPKRVTQVKHERFRRL